MGDAPRDTGKPIAQGRRWDPASEHLDSADGETVFLHACRMGLEGIVAKRRDRPYRSGRSPDWIKLKNPDAPAATRVIEA
jgi:ATP-dependent DNA ligase